MTEATKMCFTCRRSDCNKVYNVQSCGADKITYLDKLKACIGDLVETDVMEMCELCIRHLRISYKFRITVLRSQKNLTESVESQETVELIKKEDLCEDINVFVINTDESVFMKFESDDVDFVKSENSASDDFCENISDSLHEHVEKERTKRKPETNLEASENITCEHCGDQFRKSWLLRKHLARVHKQISKFLCSYCGKEFKKNSLLEKHITSHTGEKNFTCSICDKKFTTLDSQRRHMKSHEAPVGHKSRRTPFLCPTCGKNFPFSNGLQRHMRIHLGIRNFECNVCYRKFRQSTHLQVHMRTHTGEKPYICDICGDKFSLKSCMDKHIDNKHDKSKTSVEELPIFYVPKDFDENY